MIGNIETNFGPLAGVIDIHVSDPNGIVPEQTVIRMADRWRIDIKWKLQGLLVGMLNGSWRVRVYLESMGGMAEPMILNEPVPFPTGATPDPFTLQYHLTRDFGPNVPAEEGVYKLVVVITSVTPANTPGPFAGFVDGPLLQFYHAP
jgi:hypothetical protein